MVMLASIYGNVLVEQGRYEERIASGLSLDIQALARSHPIKELVVDGVVPYCPIVQHATREYNIVRVSRNLDSDRLLGDYAHHVYEYYGINLPPERSAERRSELIAKATRSEEHTSELQSHSDLVCRLLLEKKNKTETL